MKKTILMDKYPIFSLEIEKSETTFTTVDEILEHISSLIEAHPVAKFIAIFDHYGHTSSMEDGIINEEIKDAKNIIFCFGKMLPSTKILAVRPRSIGISELENSFVLDFLEVPNEQLHKVTEEWVKSVANR